MRAPGGGRLLRSKSRTAFPSLWDWVCQSCHCLSRWWCACWPGLAPAGEALFFASPKKSPQKKGDPAVCVPCASLRGNLRCSVQPGSDTNSPSAQTSVSPGPSEPPLLGAYRRGGGADAGRPDALRASGRERGRQVCTRQQYTWPNEAPFHRPAGRGKGGGLGVGSPNYCLKRAGDGT